jgi:hypothetical protein
MYFIHDFLLSHLPSFHLIIRYAKQIIPPLSSIHVYLYGGANHL